MTPPLRIFTVGHAAHATEHLFALLGAQGVELLVDIRSQPFSRHAPQHSKHPLEQAAACRGLGYRFLGRALGGRPSPADLRRPREERAAAFDAALDEVLGLARAQRLALLCAEEDPARCHRHHLLARALLARGAEVLHLRGDGRVERAAELAAAIPEQLDLFR